MVVLQRRWFWCGVMSAVDAVLGLQFSGMEFFLAVGVLGFLEDDFYQL
jgi:hypothetical protein